MAKSRSKSRTGSKKCPKGKIMRKSYSRKSYRRKNGSRVSRARVSSSCVKDMGKKGKTPKSKRVLPKPKKGELRSYGYSTKKSAIARHRSLSRASTGSKDQKLKVIRHLNLIRNYQADPTAKKKMSDDIKWLSKEYKKSKKGSKRRSRK